MPAAACHLCGSAYKRSGPSKYCGPGCRWAAQRRQSNEHQAKAQLDLRCHYVPAEDRGHLTGDYLLAVKRDPCCYCHEPATTLDHVVPTSLGGTNDTANVTAACGSCNSSKHQRSLLLFLLSERVVRQMQPLLDEYAAINAANLSGQYPMRHAARARLRPGRSRRRATT